MTRYAHGRGKRYKTGAEKSPWQKLSDLFAWLMREHENNTMYYAYGLHLQGSRAEEVIGRREILAVKREAEAKLQKINGTGDVDYSAITKDKFYANSILAANGIPCIKNEAVYTGGRWFTAEGKEAGPGFFEGYDGEFVLKSPNLEAGEGVLVCSKKGDRVISSRKDYTVKEFINLLGKSVWVLQKKVESHPAIKKVNATALNTTRIVTLRNGTDTIYIGGFQAFAAGDAVTDSWSAGSLYVGFDTEKEILLAEGYANLSVPEAIVYKHPDSGIVFEGYAIPYLKDAVQLCKSAHAYFYNNFMLGWDVAITEQGPVMVEVNEKPGMNVVQCIGGGLRRKIKDFAAGISG